MRPGFDFPSKHEHIPTYEEPETKGAEDDSEAAPSPDEGASQDAPSAENSSDDEESGR